MSTSPVSLAPRASLMEDRGAVPARHPLRRRYLLGLKRSWPLSVGVTYLALFGMLALNSCVNQKNVATEEAPLTEDAIVRLADKMRSQGDVTMAADFYQRALERDANNISAYLGLAALHEQLGQSDQAGRYYLEAIRRDGRNMNTRRAYARLLMTQEQYGAATEQYQAALSNDGDDPRARNGIGVALDQQGQHAKAQEHYRQVLAQDPDNMTALNNLGLSLLASGDAPGAITAMAPAADSLKLTPALRQNLALAYVMTGQDAMALGLLRRDLGAAEAGRILAQLRKQQRAGIKPVSQARAASGQSKTAAAALVAPEAVPVAPVTATPNQVTEPLALKKPLNPVVAEIAATANMPAGIVLSNDEGAHPEAKPVAAEPDATPRVQAVAIAKPEPMVKPEAAEPVPAAEPTPVPAKVAEAKATEAKAAEVKAALPVAEAAPAPAAAPDAGKPAVVKPVADKPRVTPPVVAKKAPKAAPKMAPTEPPLVFTPEPAPAPNPGNGEPVVTGKREQPAATRPLLARTPSAPAVPAAAGATSAMVGPFATGAMADMQSAAIRGKFSSYLPSRPVMNVKTSLSPSGTPQFVVQVHGFAQSEDAQDFCDRLKRRDYVCAVQ